MYGPPTRDLPWAVYAECCNRLQQFDVRTGLHAFDGAHGGTMQALSAMLGGDTFVADRVVADLRAIAYPGTERKATGRSGSRSSSRRT